MKVRAQIGKVLNLDKCIGCHTCSVACKQVWTSREGVEYAWFNNVETKPGTGYPTEWENQDKWNGGWEKVGEGKIKPRARGRFKIFANTNLPSIDDYYEPFSYEYSKLQNAPKSKTNPTARAVSVLTGETMEKVEKGPNWEDQLGGEFAKRSADYNFKDEKQKEIYGEFEKTFMFYMPRLCEHCLNPACVAICPSGAIYKREEDGIVLIDQEKCRGWRMCVSGCPYKKIYFNWSSQKSEKCTFCFPRIEAGLPTLCSETCVGRIRYLGVMLYDADKIDAMAATESEKDLYEAQNSIFLNPNDPAVIEAARAEGIPEAWIEAAQKSPVYKMIIDWKIAFPLHPEYRTLPMVWYIPPLSPIQRNFDEEITAGNIIPTLKSLSIPLSYLANLLTAGEIAPVEAALNKMLSMRAFMRSKLIEKNPNAAFLNAGLSEAQCEEMYRYLAIADYTDRFVIPTSHKEYAENAFDMKASCGFNFEQGNTMSKKGKNLFGGK
ncbi:MAG: nitrate reductase subunit beta [Alphaproteobacteria bacterium]|jgi:nitrate reductase beta subunit|nr:nitrate reductase subunit beta [Alphaproteobacteria bacterium]